MEGSSTIHPAYPFFAQPRPLLTGPPRGRDPATQHIMIDCDSSVQGKRSCQALDTNSGSGTQKKLSFPGSCLPSFRLAILSALVRAVMLQRTLPRNSCTALPSFDVDANPSATNELSFGSSCHPCLLRAANAPAPGACWRALRQKEHLFALTAPPALVVDGRRFIVHRAHRCLLISF